MKKIPSPAKALIGIFFLLSFNSLHAQNIGIGTPSPVTKLHILSSTSNPLKVDGAAGMYITLTEGGLNRGYLGSFAGNAEDVDFGTYAGNSTGKLHFTIQDVPKMTIDASGDVGIGTLTPSSMLSISANTNTYGFRVDQGGSGDGILCYVNTTSNTRTIFKATSLAVGLSVLGNGYVGIGTTTPDYPLDVTGTGNFVGVNVGVVGTGNTGVRGFSQSGNSGRYGVTGLAQDGPTDNYGIQGIGIGGTEAYGIFADAGGATTNWAGYFGGNVYTTGTYQSSDRKLKNGIKHLSNAISVINQLSPSVYTYRTNEYKHMHLPEGIHYGLIADEVQRVIPGAVTKAVQPAEYENHDEKNGKKLNDKVEFNAVNYIEIIPILIGAVKEQQVIISDQQKKIDELEKRLRTIEKRVL